MNPIKLQHQAKILNISTKDKTQKEISEELSQKENALSSYLSDPKHLRLINVELHLTLQIPQNITTPQDIEAWILNKYRSVPISDLVIDQAESNLFKKWNED